MRVLPDPAETTREGDSAIRCRSGSEWTAGERLKTGAAWGGPDIARLSRLGDGAWGGIMQIKLKIALAAASFALATIPAFAVEMPTDGSKNFSSPNDAPSYFTNETVPESARVANPASFTSEDVAAVPEDGPAVSGATETGRHDRHASAHSSTKHSLGRSRGHGSSRR
jgi:hypothetical protein